MTRLDWRDRRHYGGKPQPCRVCGKPTMLLDDQREPCHKTCAEQEVNP